MTTSNNVGYMKFSGTGLPETILASTQDVEKISIMVSAAATDPTNSNGTELLRRGLLMYQPAGQDTYKELDVVPTLDECKSIIVLGENVEMNAGGAPNNADASCMGYFSATFKKDKIFDATGFDTNTHWNDIVNGTSVAGSGAVVSRLRVRTNA